MQNTASQYRQMIQALLPGVEQYIQDSQSRQVPVLKQQVAHALAKELQLEEHIRKGGLTTEKALAFTKSYLENSQHMHHPRYIGHQVSSHHLAAGVADFIQGAINNPMAIYEMGPSSSVIEQTIVNWMLEKAGWLRAESITDFRDIPNNGGGILTHGGSMANLTAMLAARARVAPAAWEDGTPQDLAVIGSEVAHYSIARSLSIVGLGSKSLIKVKTDTNEVLLPDDLPRALHMVPQP